MRGAPRRLVPMKQTRKPLLIVALLALGVFGVITGILVSAHGALGQPTPSNASPSDEDEGSQRCRLLQGWGHDGSTTSSNSRGLFGLTCHTIETCT
jgi:hypothetical protein